MTLLLGSNVLYNSRPIGGNLAALPTDVLVWMGIGAVVVGVALFVFGLATGGIRSGLGLLVAGAIVGLIFGGFCWRGSTPPASSQQ